MALEFETMTPAGRFGDTCETTMMDLRPLVPDEVLRSIPRFLGRWEDSTEGPVITDDRYSITLSADDCDPSTANRELLDCTILMPDQRLVSIGFTEMPYRDTLQRFCKAKRLTRFPTLFTADGSFDQGNEVAGPFLRYLLAELRGPLMKHLRDTLWNGDDANRHNIDGILTQIANGPRSSGGGCSVMDVVNFDWNTLVNGAGLSAPSATIVAGQDAQIIHGVSFSGLTGLNAVEFLREWMERLLEHDLAAWGDQMVEFELWVGRGEVSCWAELAACMQPCTACVDPLSDPTIRARAAEFQKTRVIWLYPWDNVRITIRTSPELTNTAMFLPVSIGGRPMQGIVFRDQQEELGILSGELPMYGAQTGLPDANMVYPVDEVDPGVEFEQRAFSLHLARNGNCIQAWINTELAVALFGTGYYLKLDNVSCGGLVPVIEQTMPRAVTATVNGTVGTELDMTVAALEDDFAAAVAAGDTVLVNFNDGVTQLIATVVAYTPATDLLEADFGFAIVATDFSGTAATGPATVTKLADNT